MMYILNKIKDFFVGAWNMFLDVFPGITFWQNFVQKLFSFFVSFKVWVVVLTSTFRVMEYIDGPTWATTVVSITLGRVLVQGVVASKKKTVTQISDEDFEDLMKNKPTGE